KPIVFWGDPNGGTSRDTAIDTFVEVLGRKEPMEIDLYDYPDVEQVLVAIYRGLKTSQNNHMAIKFSNMSVASYREELAARLGNIMKMGVLNAGSGRFADVRNVLFIYKLEKATREIDGKTEQ